MFAVNGSNAQGEVIHKGTLDELWKNAREYKKTISVDGEQVVVVENATQSWTTGKAVIPEFIGMAINAVSMPFLELPPTARLNREVPKENANLECVGSEPKIEGVSEETRLALTTFCMAQGNHLVRLILLPGDFAVTFNDIQPFGKKYVARSIEVTQAGRLLVWVHVTVLTPAADFSALEAPPPNGAELLSSHRADHPYTSGPKPGQLLKRVEPMITSTGFRGTVVVKVHIDTTGKVEHAEIVGSENQLIKDAALAAVKQWQWRASYQGDKVVTLDTRIAMNFGSYLK